MFRTAVHGGRTRPSAVVLSKAKKKDILTRQGWGCLYCRLSFWSWLIYDRKRNKVVEHRIHWDHFVPYAYTRSHGDKIVASCNICNLMKSSKMFDTLEEAREHLKAGWRKRYRIWESLGSELASGAEKPFNGLDYDSDFVLPSADSIGTTTEQEEPLRVSEPLATQEIQEVQPKLRKQYKRKRAVDPQRVAAVDLTEIDQIIAERRRLRNLYGP